MITAKTKAIIKPWEPPRNCPNHRITAVSRPRSSAVFSALDIQDLLSLRRESPPFYLIEFSPLSRDLKRRRKRSMHPQPCQVNGAQSRCPRVRREASARSAHASRGGTREQRPV